jgi:hypothetical protein
LGEQLHEVSSSSAIFRFSISQQSCYHGTSCSSEMHQSEALLLDYPLPVPARRTAAAEDTDSWAATAANESYTT